jgi:hypothetical protein
MSLTSLAILLLFLWPDAARPQTVRGHVLESGSEHPIVLAEVTLLDTAMAVVDRTFSAHDGAFELKSPRPGSFYVRVGAMGYRTKLDGMVELAEDGLLPVLFYLVPEPVALEGVTATAERRRIEQFLESQDFYKRKADGFGHFITPEEIEERNVRDYVRLFQLIPEVRVTRSSLSKTRVDIRRCYYSRLPPAVYIDGHQVDLRWDTFADVRDRMTEGGLEDVVQASDILAVEVYSGAASTPIQWTGTNILRTCGTIVIWTKGGG